MYADFSTLPAQPEARKQALLSLHEVRKINREMLPLCEGKDWRLLAEAFAKKHNLDFGAAMVKVFHEAPATLHKIGKFEFSAASGLTHEQEKKLCEAAQILARERKIDFTEALDELLPDEEAPKPAQKADFSMDTRADEIKLRDAARELARRENIDFTTALDRLLPD